jgi:transposase
MDTSRPAVVEAVPTRKASSCTDRQHRSPEIKRKIVEETLAPGASVARVARAHGVNANQVFQWRRLYLAGRLGAPIAAASRLLPVSVSGEPAKDALESPVAEVALALTSARAASSTGPGAIHLELRKARLRIEGNIDLAVLRLVLKALLG